mmetsp:Transcript_25257/g.79752  ORF Transcript_25257/g.79752 Transcript_25257/m.79752 type:complete len:373 (-) Transcript_25257:1832-2950(-)
MPDARAVLLWLPLPPCGRGLHQIASTVRLQLGNLPLAQQRRHPRRNGHNPVVRGAEACSFRRLSGTAARLARRRRRRRRLRARVPRRTRYRLAPTAPERRHRVCWAVCALRLHTRCVRRDAGIRALLYPAVVRRTRYPGVAGWLPAVAERCISGGGVPTAQHVRRRQPRCAQCCCGLGHLPTGPRGRRRGAAGCAAARDASGHCLCTRRAQARQRASRLARGTGEPGGRCGRGEQQRRGHGKRGNGGRLRAGRGSVGRGGGVGGGGAGVAAAGHCAVGGLRLTIPTRGVAARRAAGSPFRTCAPRRRAAVRHLLRPPVRQRSRRPITTPLARLRRSQRLRLWSRRPPFRCVRAVARHRVVAARGGCTRRGSC